LVRDVDDTYLRVDGAEGVVFCGDLYVGQCAEEGGFTYVGQSYDTVF